MSYLIIFGHLYVLLFLLLNLLTFIYDPGYKILILLIFFCRFVLKILINVSLLYHALDVRCECFSAIPDSIENGIFCSSYNIDKVITFFCE